MKKTKGYGFIAPRLVGMVYSNQVEIEVMYMGKSCQMISTVAQGVLGCKRSLSVDQVLRSAVIWAWQRKYKPS